MANTVGPDDVCGHIYDVVVVGSGGAGLRAAIAAQRAGKRVLVVTKGMALHSGATESANFSYCAQFGYFGPDDTSRRYADDLLQSGLGMARPDLARRLAAQSSVEAEELERMGMPWDRDSDGRYDLANFAGHAFPRAIHVNLRTGKAMMRALGKTVAEAEIAVWEYAFAVDVAVTNGRVAGLLCLDIRSGALCPVRARSVVIATGGAMEMFELHTNPTDLTGDGVALAYRAGAALVDMEFLQTYPTVFVSPPGARGVHFPTGRLLDMGARLVNAEGSPFFNRYCDGPVNKATRDTLSRAMAHEILNGGGTPRGGLFIDATHLPADAVRAKFVKTYFDDLGIDPCAEPQEVAPAAHYMMGGIRIDDSCATNVPGLFAAGETAGGVHGANRLTGTALTEIIVFGAEAGRSAARYAESASELPVEAEVIREAERRLDAIRGHATPNARPKSGSGGNSFRPGVARQQVQKLMQTEASVLKSADSLDRALAGLAKIEADVLPRVALVRAQAECNWELVEALEVANIVTAARIHCAAARTREETRGAHNRLDFLKTDDNCWRVRLLLRRNGDTVDVEREAVEAQ